LQNKWNFVENNTAFLQHVLKMHEVSLLPKYIQLISKDVFLGAFVCANARLYMVKCGTDVLYMTKIIIFDM